MPNTPSRLFHIIGYLPTLAATFRAWGCSAACWRGGAGRPAKSLTKINRIFCNSAYCGWRRRHAAALTAAFAATSRSRRRHPATFSLHPTAFSLRGCHGRACKSRCKSWCACRPNAACAHNGVVSSAAVHIGGRRGRKSTAFTTAFTATCWSVIKRVRNSRYNTRAYARTDSSCRIKTIKHISLRLLVSDKLTSLIVKWII